MGTQASTLNERVAAVLDLIRPAVQADGGDIEFVDVTEDGVVQIRMHGACVGCPSSDMTLRIGIERTLRERIPEVKSVEAVA
ncbi:MAG: NifU family protein [Phycisphaerales bacterium]|nr:NifU family protein [Phycisphaerales bacterium]